MSPPTFMAMSPRSRHRVARSSPAAASVSFHQTCSLTAPSGVRPPLSTTRVGVPRWRTRWASLARMSPASRSTTTACICSTSCGAGLALLGDGAGDDIERRALAPRPGGEGLQLVEGRGVGLDPDVVGLAVPALPLVDEAADRDQALAVAEHHIEEDAELLGIGLDAERVFLQRRVVEVAPRVEVDHLAVARPALVDRRIVVIGHCGRLQQRLAQAHMRHSK